MDNEKLETIKNEIQFIIDCIAKKNFANALKTLNNLNTDLNDLIDVTVDQEMLREISKYQVLVDYLSAKII